MPDFTKAAIIGGGVIGGGWVARFALNGIDVAVFDPDPEAPRKIGEVYANAERALRALCVAPLPKAGTITYANSIAEAVDGAQWIQESVSEVLALKHKVFAEVQAVAPDTLIGSSTSGFKPSELQQGATNPASILVAHPFNPVYLLPLVELVPSAATGADILEFAQSVLPPLGMQPLVVRKEIDAHIADRFLEAVWREALWLVKDGIATTEEIDDAIRFGFGLRWAQMGLFETYRVAGGEAGMKHFMAQFGPCLTFPWTKLMDVPEFTEELVDLIAGQSDAQSGRYSIRELERIRDDNLVGILQALKVKPWGAGETLAAYEKQLREASFDRREEQHDYTKSLPLYNARVLPEWVDYNGHMTEFRYLHVFGDATDAFLTYIGMDSAYMARGRSIYTVESHIRHIQEIASGKQLKLETQLLGYDEKRVRLSHVMREAETGALLATGEHMLLSVDTHAGKATPLEDPVSSSLSRIWDGGQKNLTAPDFAGRAIRDI